MTDHNFRPCAFCGVPHIVHGSRLPRRGFDGVRVTTFVATALYLVAVWSGLTYIAWWALGQ